MFSKSGNLIRAYAQSLRITLLVLGAHPSLSTKWLEQALFLIWWAFVFPDLSLHSLKAVKWGWRESERLRFSMKESNKMIPDDFNIIFVELLSKQIQLISNGSRNQEQDFYWCSAKRSGNRVLLFKEIELHPEFSVIACIFRQIEHCCMDPQVQSRVIFHFCNQVSKNKCAGELLFQQ